MVTLPEDLRRLALIGTSSRPPTTPPNQFEKDLLLTVATYGLKQQAGYLPNTLSNMSLSQVPLEQGQPCSVKASKHLLLMLNGRHQALLPTWFQLLQDHQQHIPYELLPSLLDFGVKSKSYKSLLRPIIGERGRWLVEIATTVKWQWIFKDESPNPTYAGDHAAWTAYFRRLRQTDPEYALTILRDYWDDLDPLMQTSLLMVMEIGINPKDTSFLMKLLDNPLTHNSAVELLLRLKTSDFARAFFDKVSQLISMTKTAQNNQWVVNFTPPSTQTAQGQQNAVHGQQLYTIMGYNFALDTLLMLLPLSYWYDTYHVTAQNLVEAANNSSRPTTFFWAWRDKAIEVSDNDFLFALAMSIEHYTGSPIVEHLTQEQCIQAAIHWLIQDPIFRLNHPAVPLLDAIKQVWDADLACVFLNSLKAHFQKATRPLLLVDMRKCLQRYAIYLPLTLIDQFEQVLSINSYHELSDTEIDELNGIIDVMTFRVAMIAAIENR